MTAELLTLASTLVDLVSNVAPPTAFEIVRLTLTTIDNLEG